MSTTTDNTDNEHMEFRRPSGYQPGCMIASIIVVALTVLAFLGMTIGELIVAAIMTGLDSAGTEMSIGPIQGIVRFSIAFMTCGFYWLIVRYKNPFSHIGLGLGRLSARGFALGILLGFIAIGLTIIFITMGRGIYLVNYPPSSGDYATIGPFTWPAVLFMILMYATAEEVLFRGFLYPWLKKSAGFWVALVITSILFSLIHIGNPAFFTSPFPFTNIILASVFLTLLRDLTGNIWAASGAHFIWNFILVAVGIPVSGMYLDIQPRVWWLADNGPAWLTGGEFGPEGGAASTIALIILCWIVWRMYQKRERQ